eukprot:scaffold1033_cov454-Pavlova_lutheri.AAC.2
MEPPRIARNSFECQRMTSGGWISTPEECFYSIIRKESHHPACVEKLQPKAWKFWDMQCTIAQE